MSRIINPEGAGKDRKQLCRAIILAVRELMTKEAVDENCLDLAAFLAITLAKVDETIDVSVTAWEKKGYWIKADRFRMDWRWAGIYSQEIRKALLERDWNQIALTSVKIAEKLKNEKIPVKHRLGTPWTGSYQRLLIEERSIDN